MNDDEFIHRRVLRAPRELVWRCLTEPAELAQFWGPAGMTTPVDGIVVELRPGGRFETLMVGAHGSHRMVATFTEVVPPERLGWVEAASGLHTTSTLEDLGDGTTALVIHQRHVPEGMRRPEARAGFLTSLDRLEHHLGGGDGRQAWVAQTYRGLAEQVDAGDAWDAQSLCEKWLVRHVIAHVTMPARLTPERFGAEMAAARGDFAVLSDTVARRDASLPVADLLDQLRSPQLHAWVPPVGGADGALRHAVIHSLDVTIALGRPPVAPKEAVSTVLGQLIASDGAWFGVRPAEVAATDDGSLVALLSGRQLPGA